MPKAMREIFCRPKKVSSNKSDHDHVATRRLRESQKTREKISHATVNDNDGMGERKMMMVVVIVITVMQGTMIKSISYGFCHAIIFIATYKTYACTIRELMSHRIFQIACMYALMVSGTSDFRHFFYEKKERTERNQ